MAAEYVLPASYKPRANLAKVVQSIINIAAALGACSGPLIIGALSRYDPENGWRKYFVSPMYPQSFSSANLTLVDPNGTLGSHCNLHLRWL